MKIINLFFGRPEGDRWFPMDRYPRRIIRRLVRGKPSIGGHKRVFLNLCAGLDALRLPYRINDYKHIKRNPNDVACIVGKHHLLNKINWRNPIVFGPAVFSHPVEDPHLLERLPVKKVLVPGEWMRKMFEPYYGNRVGVCPTGIDTALWTPDLNGSKKYDFLLYVKIRWDIEWMNKALVEPIEREMKARGIRYIAIRYGTHKPDQYLNLLRKSKAMLFLCEHETQGLAYQEALSCDVPILAWDRGGLWRDPAYFPDRVQFEPVSSVPFWDERCGIIFRCLEEFPKKLDTFMDSVQRNSFKPRDYIMDHLTLEKCAAQYASIVHSLEDSGL